MSTKITGSIQVRSATLIEWSDSSVPEVGANRVLKTGELGWVIGTYYFKIGDGIHKWSELDYITLNESIYAERLGTEGGYHTYDSINEFKNSVIQSIDDLNNYKNIYVNTVSDLPSVGKQGPIYIVKSTGDSYFFNIGDIPGVDLGYIKLNGFDILQARFDN